MTGKSLLDWKHVFNSIKDSIVLLDTNGFIKDCNEAFYKLVNKSSTQIIGFECSKIIFDRTDSFKKCPFLRSKRSKKRESLTVEKNDRWINVDVDPIFDENHKITGFILFMSDITERKMLQESLINSEERYRSLSKATFQAIFISEKGICIEQNSIAEKMFGYTLSEAIGRNGTDWITPEYREIVMNNMLSGNEAPYKVIALRKDGSTFPAEIQGKMIPYKGRTVRVTALRDISERNKSEKSLRDSEEKFRTLTENINVGIYRNTVGAKGKFIEANPAIVKMFGFKNREEFLAYNVSELYLQPEERKNFNDKMREKGFVKDKVLLLKQKDGTPFFGSISAVTIKDNEGNLQYYDGIIEDITKRKKTEKALWESEKKYKDLFEKSKDAFLIIHNGKFVDCNQATIDMLRYKNKREFLNTHPSELSPEKQHDGKMSFTKADEMMRIAYEKGSHRFEWDHKRSDGEIFPVEVLLTSISSDKKNQILHTVWRDITDRKKTEKALEKEKEYYHSFVTSLSDWVWEMDMNGIHTYSNLAVESILGYRAEDVVGHHVKELWGEGETTAKSLKILHEALSAGKGWKNVSGRFKHKNGSIIITESTAIPIYDSKNKLIGYRGIDHDITESKQAEEALKKQNLKYQTLLLNLDGMVYRCKNDKKWTMEFISAGCLSLTGYKPEDLLENNKLSYNDLILPEYKDYLWEKWQEKLKTHEPVETEYEIRTAAGDIKWVWERGRGIFDENGRLTHLEGLITDITERKRTEQIQEVIYNISNTAASTDDLEEMISQIHKELGTMIDTTNFYIALYDEKKDMFSLPFLTDAKDKTINFPAGKTLTNYVRKTQKSLLANKKVKVELEKSGDIELFGTDSKVWLGVPLKVEGKITGVLAVQSYTNELAYTKSDLKMLEFVSNQVSISIERKRIEIALKENERRYKYLFNQSPTSIWEEDYSDVYRYLTSLKKSGIKDFKEYFENHLDEVKKCSELVRILDINEMTIQLFNAKSKEDLITNLNSIFTKDSLSPFINQLCAIAENHTRYNGETVNKTLDGELLNVFVKLNVVPGYEKDYSRVLITLMDITGQKLAEEELRNGRERLKMLNKIIRHDISNDFIVIKSAINIFRRTSNATMMNEIEKRVDKSLTAIDSYRKYESFIDLNQDLEELEITELLNELILEFPKIKFNIQGNCKVFADETINSVFINLITNSIKHGKASEIDVKISTESNKCEIKFMDNGTGIPDKIIDKIFDEGFSHGKAGHTGIGLHIVRKTIESFGGSISVENIKPNGAVFKIKLKKAL